MSNKTISALPTISSPSNGNDILPIVDNGVTSTDFGASSGYISELTSHVGPNYGNNIYNSTNYKTVSLLQVATWGIDNAYHNDADVNVVIFGS